MKIPKLWHPGLSPARSVCQPPCRLPGQETGRWALFSFVITAKWKARPFSYPCLFLEWKKEACVRLRVLLAVPLDDQAMAGRRVKEEGPGRLTGQFGRSWGTAPPGSSGAVWKEGRSRGRRGQVPVLGCGMEAGKAAATAAAAARAAGRASGRGPRGRGEPASVVLRGAWSGSGPTRQRFVPAPCAWVVGWPGELGRCLVRDPE